MAASDFLQSVTAQHAFAIAALLASLALGLYLLRGKIRLLWLYIKTRRRLSRLGLQQITDFEFADGLGGYFTVDRLVMLPDGISLLLFKQFPGSIFCAEHIDEWTQMLEGKSYHFRNPLVDLDYQIKTVAACVRGVPVDGYLFFDHTSRFPKGHPDQVIQLDTIPQSFKRDKKEKAKAEVVAAWETLRALHSKRGQSPLH